MSLSDISNLIIEYRYWLLIPLSILEGPIVAFIAGTLASLNYFNIYILIVIFFIRDIGMDLSYYAAGYFGGKTKFAKNMLLKINISEKDLSIIGKVWEEHPLRTMFIGKLSYGIAQAFVAVAGTVKMPLRLFLKYGVLVTIAQYGTLLALGYFFGDAFGGNLTNIINNIEYVIACFTIIISGYYVISWYMRKKFMKEDKKIEEEENKNV